MERIIATVRWIVIIDVIVLFIIIVLMATFAKHLWMSKDFSSNEKVVVVLALLVIFLGLMLAVQKIS